MVNQWGRDGTASSGSRSSGGAGIVIAAVVALVLGGGGGYAGARLLGGVSSGDVQARDTRIATLEKELADLKFQGAGTESEDKALRERIQELTKANETLKALADENSGNAGEDAQAEIAALKKTIEEAGDVRGELTRARRSLQVSELQIIDLESMIKGQNDELKKLRDSLANAAGNDELENLRKRMANADKTLAAREKELRDITTSAREAQIRMDAANTNAAKAQAEAARLGTSLRQAETERGRLTREVAALKQAVEALQSPSGDDTTQPDVTQLDDTPTRRDTAAVQAALDDMPGFTGLTPQRQTELARRLTDGECAADALKSTLGRVPAIALRNLIRDLGSRC